MADSMSAQERLELTNRVKERARLLGFDGVGIAPAVLSPGYDHYMGWLAEGHNAGMDYLRRNAQVREHPDRILPGVRSLIVVSLVYGEPIDQPASEERGRVARYARGSDYHDVLWRKLEELLSWLEQQAPGIRGRAVADTAPLLEREFARLAGLGWLGKNTMLIHKRLGSFTFLGALLVDLQLTPDEPHRADHCGTCTRCLEACPTGAFPAPYQLDANRCISYWTIEHKGRIPEEYAERLHGWAFGCDICQEVCPWNRKAPPGAEPSFRSREEWASPNLIEWLERDREVWTILLRGSAMKRAKRVGLVRNAVLILGTRRVESATEALAGLLGDASEDPVIRASAAWALGRIGSDSARGILLSQQDDSNPEVVDAVRIALTSIDAREETGSED